MICPQVIYYWQFQTPTISNYCFWIPGKGWSVVTMSALSKQSKQVNNAQCIRQCTLILPSSTLKSCLRPRLGRTPIDPCFDPQIMKWKEKQKCVEYSSNLCVRCVDDRVITILHKNAHEWVITSGSTDARCYELVHRNDESNSSAKVNY